MGHKTEKGRGRAWERGGNGRTGGTVGQVSLGSLPPLLRHDETLAGLAGVTNAVLAVPEPARAYVVAGLAHLSSRHPIVVATPTGSDSDRLAHDLRAYLGDDAVDLFPAWETLPFE